MPSFQKRKATTPLISTPILVVATSISVPISTIVASASSPGLAVATSASSLFSLVDQHSPSDEDLRS